MLPLDPTTAVWYCPVDDNDIEFHILFPGAVRSVHVTP
jgi:hypothetical protein